MSTKKPTGQSARKSAARPTARKSVARSKTPNNEAITARKAEIMRAKAAA